MRACCRCCWCFFWRCTSALFRRHGISSKLPLRGADAPFWPDQVFKDAVACLAVLTVVLFLVVRPALFSSQGPLHTPHAQLGAEFGAPADPANPYSAARPEWYFLFLFQFLKLFEGHGASGEFLGAIVVPGLRHAIHVSDALHRPLEIGTPAEYRLSAFALRRHRLADFFRLSRRSPRPMGRLENVWAGVCRGARCAAGDQRRREENRRAFQRRRRKAGRFRAEAGDV